MAHRLAELIVRAQTARSEKTREAARKEASALVLRVWRRRSHWPRGWPPRHTAQILAVLDPQPYRSKRGRTDSPWLDALPRLDELQSRERRVWLNFALADLDVTEEEGKLKSAEGAVSARERETIERVLRERAYGIDEILRVMQKSKLPQSPSARASAAALQLEEFARDRASLVKETVALVQKSERRRPRPRKSRPGEGQVARLRNAKPRTRSKRPGTTGSPKGTSTER
jgi:hypothetical protein